MKIIAIVISVFLSSPLVGQNNLLYPDLFSGFFNHQGLINPAFQTDTGRVAFLASLKSRTGAFKNIATYAASLDRNFMNKRNAGHTVRLIFFNEKEGPYIEKPRGYINYAYRLALAGETFLSAGVSGGFAQVAYTAPSATATGTTTLPDVSIGMYLRRKKFRTGIASMQLLNNASPSANLSVKLGRYYNLFMATEKELGYLWKLKGYLFYRFLPEHKDNLDLALLLSYRDFFTFGSSARYGQGMSFFVSLHIPSGSSVLQLNFAYNTPLLSGNTSLNNSLEISPVYLLR